MDSAFGENPNISGPEDIWPGGGDYTGFPEELETLQALSTSADDSAAGTGAQTIQIEGLDADWNIIKEIVTLDGLTPVVTTGQFRRVHHVTVLTAGSTGGNVGKITVRHSQTTANVFSVMSVGFNRSTDCAYTIPAGHTGLVVRVSIFGSRGSSTISADFSLRTREPGKVFQVYRIYTAGNGQGINIEYTGGFIMKEKTDIKMRCDSISSANGDFNADFAFILRKN